MMLEKRESMLEISIGAYSEVYEKHGNEWLLYIGIDKDIELLGEAKKQGLEAVCCDAFNLPFKSKSIQDVYIQCFTSLLSSRLKSHRGSSATEDGEGAALPSEEFCEFLGKTDFEWTITNPFYELLIECKRVCKDYLVCLPSCDLKMNKYLINAVKNLPSIIIDAEPKKRWGSKKNKCVMFIEIFCSQDYGL
jgi:hypothetical protein